MNTTFEITPARGPDDVRSFGVLLEELTRWDIEMSRASGLDVDALLQFHHEHSLEDFVAELEPPAGRLLLAKDETGAFGCAALRALTSEIGEVKSLYVRPSYRGRGAASALMRALIAEGMTIGYRALRLTSAAFMTDAHRVYDAMGVQADRAVLRGAARARRRGHLHGAPAALDVIPRQVVDAFET